MVLDSLKYVPEDYFNETNRGVIKEEDILICKDGALTGKVALVPKPKPFSKAMINEHVFLLRTNDNALQRYLFHFLYSKNGQSLLEVNITGQAQGGLNSTNLNDIEIPLPPKDIQEKIITEIETLEQNEKAKRERVIQLNKKLNNEFTNLDYQEDKLGNFAKFKNGLNYSEKSTGDLVTIVGVKDFLEDFSPNLKKLVDVRIDGKLSDDYKLQSGDILVVRSNGSANLVGRFIYIDKLSKDISYSGFTIRIRANSDKINSKYLCYCLRTEKVRNAITKDPKGANIKSVNQTMLSSISVPLPPLSEQLKIIAKVEKIEKEIAIIESELANIDQEKEKILKKYLE